MENKILFLIVTILLLWLLLSKQGATVIKNMINSAGGSSGTPQTTPSATVVPKYDVNNGGAGATDINNNAHMGIGGGLNG